MSLSKLKNSHRICIITLALVCPVVVLLSLVDPYRAFAVDCIDSACLSVYTQNGKIIIEGRKGSGKNAQISPKPTPKSTPKPRVKTSPEPIFTPRTSNKPATVKPYIAPTPRKKVLRKVVAKVIAKVVPKVASTAGVSLNDRLEKLLPSGAIARQPQSGALVNVPIIYWAQLPAIFTTQVSIIGEVIDVTMRPSFLWSYGDGTFFATTKFGAPFPSDEISHTYSHAGTYLVTMLATWGGTWTHNGVARAITGQIRKLSVATVVISTANTPLNA